jgi:RNA polymerase sigma-70 factor, ECF subfamily
MKSHDAPRLSPADLLASHGPWVRRLAGALTRGDGSADDVAQETWEKVLRHPPGPDGSVRSWLGRVVATRIYNQAREHKRRRAREARVVRESLDVVAPSADETSDRVELQQELAALVGTLDDARREAVHLRYYEGLEPVEIARRLNVPAGTVRWRIKTALDELRARLDERYEGDRARWRALLLPLAGATLVLRPGPTPAVAVAAAGTAGARSWTRGQIALMVSLLAAVGALTAWHFRKTPAPLAGLAPTALPAGTPPAPPAGPPLGGLAATMPPAETCPGVAELVDQLALRRREAEERAPLQETFESSAPNPAAQAAFGQAYDRAMAGASKCLHHVECRGAICKVQVLAPEGTTPWQCFPDERESWIEARLSVHRVLSQGSQRPFYDPLTRQSYSQLDFYYPLASVDGSPVPADRQSRPAALTPGLLALRSLPSGLSPGCRRRGQHLLEQLQAVERKLARGLHAPEAFHVGAPAPELVPAVNQELARMLDLEGKPLPFATECRMNVCSLKAQDGLDPSLANRWSCKPPQPGLPELCLAPRDGNGWSARLDRAIRGSVLFERMFPPVRIGGVEGKAYLTVRSTLTPDRDEQRRVACRLANRVHRARIFQACERRFADAGELVVRLSLPGTEDPVPSPSAAAVLDYGGPLSVRPLGRCVIDGLTAILEDFRAPELRDGVAFDQTLTFPGAHRIWQRRSPCL